MKQKIYCYKKGTNVVNCTIRSFSPGIRTLSPEPEMILFVKFICILSLVKTWKQVESKETDIFLSKSDAIVNAYAVNS